MTDDVRLEMLRQAGRQVARRWPKKAATAVQVRQLSVDDPTTSEHDRDTARAWIEGAQDVLTKQGRCRMCGRRLTDSASLEAGIGPDCQTKGDR